MAITKGNKVTLDYTGTLEDGTVFDSSETHGKPLECEAGAGQLIKGFDDALIGMEVGQEKEFTLKPEEAYGQINAEMVQKIPREKIPKEAQEGAMLMMALPNGQQMPVKISKLDDKEATLDMNHPLAGKTLTFKIKIVKVS